MINIDGQISLFDTYLKPKDGDIRGLMDDPYCPTCNKPMEDYTSQCEWCGQLISWERWKNIIEM